MTPNLDALNTAIASVNDALWTYLLIGALIICGLYFTIRTRFVQFTMIGDMFRQLFDASPASGGRKHISSFQAFAVSVATRVGTGNLAGVATAIAVGGPGAVFWMWIIALIGSATAFVEATLAQLYKRPDSESFIGGPAYYISKGMKNKWMAALFAVLLTLTFGLSYNSIQSNTICGALNQAFGFDQTVVGIILSALALFIAFGGIQRIAHVSSILVPVMAIGYFILALVVVIMNYDLVPHVIKHIFVNAFGFEQVAGGGLGMTIMIGIRRGLFSNEAGEGSAPNVAATAHVSHPVKQGLVQAFSVYIDTLLVCTATAVMILACKTYNVFDASGNLLLAANGTEMGAPGVSYTTAALGTLLGIKTGGIIISVALFFFAFTTIMAYYYYAETNLVYLFGKGKKEHILIWVLRLGVVGMVFFGSLYEAKAMWDLGDIGVGMMAWINIIAILLLSPKAFKALRSYERQKKEGKDPVFDPKEIGVEGAEFWESRQAE